MDGLTPQSACAPAAGVREVQPLVPGEEGEREVELRVPEEQRAELERQCQP